MIVMNSGSQLSEMTTISHFNFNVFEVVFSECLCPCWSCHVSSSLWSNVSKVTSLKERPLKVFSKWNTKTFWKQLQSIVTFETFGQRLEQAKPDQRAKTKTKTMKNTCEIEVWNCCHFRQLKTWLHDNLCYLTIKSNTGQHSQFLRCFHYPQEPSE